MHVGVRTAVNILVTSPGVPHSPAAEFAVLRRAMGMEEEKRVEIGKGGQRRV